MLYIDNPAGSGLSYSTDPNDYNTTDSQERLDLEQTVRQWFQTYNYFQNHDVFYAGEWSLMSIIQSDLTLRTTR